MSILQFIPSEGSRVWYEDKIGSYDKPVIDTQTCALQPNSHKSAKSHRHDVKCEGNHGSGNDA